MIRTTYNKSWIQGSHKPQRHTAGQKLVSQYPNLCFVKNTTFLCSVLQGLKKADDIKRRQEKW